MWICSRPGRPSRIPPNLLEALPLAVVVAEEMDRVVLPQPAMDLGEELLALRLGDVRFRAAVANGAKYLQALPSHWRRFGKAPLAGQKVFDEMSFVLTDLNRRHAAL